MCLYLKGGSLTLGQSLLYKVMSESRITKCNFVCLQIEKSQGEIYRLRAKLESTQTENENMHDELEKMQQALNRSYADRDKIASDLEKMRDELERSQVNEKVLSRLESGLRLKFIWLCSPYSSVS